MNKELMNEIIETYMEENGLDYISEQDYGEITEAYLYFTEAARADHGNMDIASPRGEGLSPSAKREMDRQTPMPKDVNEPEVEKRTWDAFRATNVKVAAGRRGDSSKGDKKIINKPEDITARASKKEDDGFKTGQVDVSVKA